MVKSSVPSTWAFLYNGSAILESLPTGHTFSCPGTFARAKNVCISLPAYSFANGQYILAPWTLLAGPHLDSFSWGGALALSALSPMLGSPCVESLASQGRSSFSSQGANIVPVLLATILYTQVASCPRTHRCYLGGGLGDWVWGREQPHRSKRLAEQPGTKERTGTRPCIRQSPARLPTHLASCLEACSEPPPHPRLPNPTSLSLGILCDGV